MSFPFRLRVWSAMMLSSAVLLVAVFAIRLPPQPDALLGKILLGAAMALVPLAALLPKLTNVPQAWLAGLAICEAVAVMGIIARALAGSPQAWMLPLLGLCGIGLLLPQKSES